MGFKFDNNDLKEIFIDLKKKGNEILKKGMEFVKEGIAEDTFELHNSIIVAPMVQKGFIVIGKVYLDPTSPSNEYAEKVEYGPANGQTYNYYKNAGRRNGGTPFLSSKTGTRAWYKAGKKMKVLVDNLK